MTNFESRHELDLGSIDMTGRTDYGGIRFYALAEGATLGDATPSYVEIISALQDGTLVTLIRHENREPGFAVEVEADDSELLDIGQSMLTQVCNTDPGPILGWRPPDATAERRITRCWVAHAERDYDFDWDLAEHPGVTRGKLYRRYVITMDADPWMYAETPTSFVAASAPPETPVTDVLSDGSSATGWSSPVGATAQPSVSSGKLVIAPTTVPPVLHYGYVSEATKVLSAVDFSTMEYISVDIAPRSALMELWPLEENSTTTTIWLPGKLEQYEEQNFEFGLADTVAAYVDGTKLSLVNYVGNSDGSIKFTWLCTDTNASSLRVIAGTAWTGSDDEDPLPTLTSRGVTFDNVIRSNVRPGQNSTGRISSQSIFNEGSARTCASLNIATATGLGKVLCYTSPALGKQGYEPSCRPYLSAGDTSTSSDSTLVSGSRTRNGASQKITFNIPASRLPRGPYGIMPLFRFVGNASSQDNGIVTTVSHIVNGSTYWSTTMPLKPVLTPAMGSGNKPWQMVTLGIAHLPPNEVPATQTTTSFIRIEMLLDSEGDFEVDDLFVIYMGKDSAVSRIDCGTGSASIGTVHNRIWLDGPTPLDPKPRFFAGTQSDKSDAFNPGWPAISAYGIHPLRPGENRVVVINTGAAYPVISGTYFRAYA